MDGAGAPGGDFAENLRLVMSRLNLSRVELAHRLGIDKSAVRRWVLGSSQPTGVNLTVLTDLVAAEVPAFNRDTWRAPSLELAAILAGEVPRPEAPKVAPDVAPLAILPRLASQAGERDPVALSRHGGLWVMVAVAGAMAGQRLTFCSAVMFDLHAGRLRARFSDGGAGISNAQGPAFLSDNRLWIVAEREPGGSDAVMMLLDSTPGPNAMIIDGLYMTRALTTGEPVAGRCVMFRLADLSGDTQADEAAFEAAARRAGELSVFKLPEALPEWAFDALYAGRPTNAASAVAVYIPEGRNLTSVTLDLYSAMAEGHTRGELLGIIRDLFKAP